MCGVGLRVWCSLVEHVGGWSLEYGVRGGLQAVLLQSSKSQATGTILTLGLLNISLLCFVVLRCLLWKADKVASDVPWFL